VHGTIRTVLIIALVIVGVVALSYLSFRPWLQWRTTHYVFTTHRVLIRRGVMRHVGRDIALQRINDVGFAQSLWDRVVKAGTLTIESAGENGQEDLHNIPRSDQMQQTLNRLIEADADRRQYGRGPAAQQPWPSQPGQWPAQPAQWPAPPGPWPGEPPPGGPYPTEQYPPQYPEQPPPYPPRNG
jgi:membrane protein YdbS with pleckstrin-like domain